MAKAAKKSTPTEAKSDIHERLTAIIIEGLEKAAGPTEWPWVKAAKAGVPVNIVSKKGYRGLNRMMLGLAMNEGAARYWATFNQWKGKGAMVRKGSKGTSVFFYGDMYIDEAGNRVDPETPGARKILYAKGATVFSADQVDGWTAPAEGSTEAAELDAAAGADCLDDMEAFVAATGATVNEYGDKAFYHRITDEVTMPSRDRFRDTASASATSHFYGVLMHELVHWTGAKDRLDREKGKVFGDATYAFEELIAEMGSAFLCADLGLAIEPRADNIAYVANWLTVLKGDKKAIFTASSAATKAADYLHAAQVQQMQQMAA